MTLTRQPLFTLALFAAAPMVTFGAFARRKGKDWFVGIINGNVNEAVILEKLELPFLGANKHNCVWVADGAKPDEFQTGKTKGLIATNPLSVKLAPGGGYVAMLRSE